jgi:tRNA pseudouridine38-40 synthase
MMRVDLEFEPPQITITMRANSFLYKMVRNVIRTLVRVGEGRMAPEDIPIIIASKDRSAAPGTAPASGLHLETVHF